MFHKDGKDLLHIATFIGSSVQLTIGIGSGTTLTKTIIGFRIDEAFAIDLGKIPSPVLHFFPSFQHDRFQPQFNAAIGSKQSCRTGADDNHGLSVLYVFKCSMVIRELYRFVDKEYDPHTEEHLLSTSVYGTLTDMETIDFMSWNTKFFGSFSADSVLILNKIRTNGNFNFFL